MTRYGIIGCGMMGQEHIRNIALLDEAKVTAIYEPNPEMLNTTRKLVPNARVADTLISLVMGDDIDCLVIVSPNFVHVDQLRQIADLRTLPILVEILTVSLYLVNLLDPVVWHFSCYLHYQRDCSTEQYFRVAQH